MVMGQWLEIISMLKMLLKSWLMPYKMKALKNETVNLGSGMGETINQIIAELEKN